MAKNKMELYERLTAYGRTDACPFHMPGHKRNGDRFFFGNPFSFDITEIDGFDNLHHATGILKEAMEQAADIYGSERSYFLVNGSSSGLLTAISACVSRGGRLLVARNCHKAVYHGIFLRGLKPSYLCPEGLADWGAAGAVTAEMVETALKKNPEAEAVLLTSPTYEGICSDIGSIAEISHAHGIPLIVDSAHGAHLPFMEKQNPSGTAEFPASALSKGADLVVESLHKTLPSLTQTAILHKKSGLVDEARLEYYLQVYQSSSPSYVLMASIDNCLSYMDGKEGKAAMEAYGAALSALRENIAGLAHIHLMTERESRVPGTENREAERNVYYDPSKIVIRADGIGGTALYDCLRLSYHIQPEMCTETYVILMTSVADTAEMYRRLFSALEEIDRRCGNREPLGGAEPEEQADGNQPDGRVSTQKPGEQARASKPERSEKRADEPEPKEPVRAPQSEQPKKRVGFPPVILPMPQVVLPPGETEERTSRSLPERECAGRVSCEFAYIYPPGVPLLAPGELVTEEIVKILERYRESGLEVIGPQTAGRLKVLEE